MGTKTVRFSDLTNKIIDDDGEVVRLVVEQHPALTDGPVEIEASKDEVEPIRNRALNVVSLKLYQGDGLPPETITMEIEAFNKLAGDMDMEDVIRRAGPAYPPRKQAPTSSAADKLDLDRTRSCRHSVVTAADCQRRKFRGDTPTLHPGIQGPGC